MPDQISVSEFVAETLEDYKAPTASSFTTRTAHCRNTVAAIEEALDVDRMVLYKMKKSVKAINISGLANKWTPSQLGWRPEASWDVPSRAPVTASQLMSGCTFLPLLFGWCSASHQRSPSISLFPSSCLSYLEIKSINT
ncbi:arf-GAP with SH3 domain, ANK repeat and PH domain-containing protein 2 isoform X4 [Ictidomys tridecemlineatus]